MIAHLISGAAKSRLDAEIVAFVGEHPDYPPWPRVDMRVAIKNEADAIYRIISANGIIELIRTEKFLTGIGCVEAFTDEYDLLFRVLSTRPQKFPQL